MKNLKLKRHKIKSKEMKIIFCFLIVVTIYFFLSVEAQNAQRGVLTRRTNALRAQRVRRAQKIICNFFNTGRWPNYPASLRRLVATQSRRILGRSREEITNFCRELRFQTISRRPQFPYQILVTRRPQIPQRIFTARRTFTTPRFSPFSTNFTTQRTNPTSPTFVTPPTVFYPTFTTSSPITFSTATPSTTAPSTTTITTVTPSTTQFTTQAPITTTRAFGVLPILPVVTPQATTTVTPPAIPLGNPLLRIGPLIPPTTTTTTVQPTASGSGSSYYYYSGSGSAYYSGSGSAYYYSATGSLDNLDQSSRLRRPANELTRAFKAKNGDIVIKWTPGGRKLKKIGV